MIALHAIKTLGLFAQLRSGLICWERVPSDLGVYKAKIPSLSQLEAQVLWVMPISARVVLLIICDAPVDYAVRYKSI